jgi:hypothetical protein
VNQLGEGWLSYECLVQITADKRLNLLRIVIQQFSSAVAKGKSNERNRSFKVYKTVSVFSVLIVRALVVFEIFSCLAVMKLNTGAYPVPPFLLDVLLKILSVTLFINSQDRNEVSRH